MVHFGMMQNSSTLRISHKHQPTHKEDLEPPHMQGRHKFLTLSKLDITYTVQLRIKSSQDEIL
jgi:hypothetical protein